MPMQPYIHFGSIEIVSIDASFTYFIQQELIIKQTVLAQLYRIFTPALRHQVRILIPECQDARRLNTYKWMTLSDQYPHHCHIVAGYLLCQFQASLRYGSTSTFLMLWYHHPIAESQQKAGKCPSQLCLLLVRKLIGKEIHQFLRSCHANLQSFLVNQLPHRLLAQLRNVSIWRKLHDVFDDSSRWFPCRHQVIEWSDTSAHLFYLSHPCHQPGAQRCMIPVVILLQQFGAQPCHIHIRRTFTPTALAGQTRIQHLLDKVLIATTGQNFTNHVSPRPGSLQFVTAHLEGWTHRSANQIRLPAVARPVTLVYRTHQGMHLTSRPGCTRRITLVESRFPVIIGMV